MLNPIRKVMAPNVSSAIKISILLHCPSLETLNNHFQDLNYPGTIIPPPSLPSDENIPQITRQTSIFHGLPHHFRRFCEARLIDVVKEQPQFPIYLRRIFRYDRWQESLLAFNVTSPILKQIHSRLVEDFKPVFEGMMNEPGWNTDFAAVSLRNGRRRGEDEVGWYRLPRQVDFKPRVVIRGGMTGEDCQAMLIDAKENLHGIVMEGTALGFLVQQYDRKKAAGSNVEKVVMKKYFLFPKEVE